MLARADHGLSTPKRPGSFAPHRLDHRNLGDHLTTVSAGPHLQLLHHAQHHMQRDLDLALVVVHAPRGDAQHIISTSVAQPPHHSWRQRRRIAAQPNRRATARTPCHHLCAVALLAQLLACQRTDQELHQRSLVNAQRTRPFKRNELRMIGDVIGSRAHSANATPNHPRTAATTAPRTSDPPSRVGNSRDRNWGIPTIVDTAASAEFGDGRFVILTTPNPDR
jgi:hypothetical protein